MSKLERYIIGLSIAAIIIFLVWFFSNVVIYILVAAVISLMGKPFVDLLSRLHYKGVYMPSWLSATTVIVAMWGAAILVISIFIPILYENIQSFAVVGIENFSSYINRPVADVKEFLHSHFGYEMTLSGDAFVSDINSRLTTIINSSVSSVTSIIDFISSAFIALFSITFIAFFFLKENQLFNEGVIMMFPQKYSKDVSEAINSSITLISKYFLGLVAESIIKTFVIGLGLYIIGLDFASSFVIALISGVLNVIPYIGPLIGAGVGFIVAAVTPSLQPTINVVLLQMAILFLIFQLIDNIILQPYIYSNSVKAHPLEIFLVILIAGSIAGVWGMLLAIPAYTVLRVFAKIFFKKFMVVQKLTNKI